MSGRTSTISTVRVAGKRDRVAVAEMFARAFADDPALAFIFPDPIDRAKRLPLLFRLLFDSDGQAGMRLLASSGEAATLWRGPGSAHASTMEMIRQAWPMLRALGAALGRALSVANAIEQRLPAGAFWYLHVAGCDPIAQGRGLGGAVVKSGLQRVRASGLPIYLETATEKNIGFYQLLGFQITADWRVSKGGPQFWSMLRNESSQLASDPTTVYSAA